MNLCIKACGPAALLAFAGAAPAQDSTALTPGGSDALSPYDTARQSVAYVVDLAPITSSWGAAYAVGPILKAPSDLDAQFPTQLPGAAALSADQLTGVTFASRSYLSWNAPGQGVNAPSKNAAPAGSVAITGYDRQFGAALTGISTGATNIVSAIVGQNASDLSRLYVVRTTALCSRADNAPTTLDTATLALGAIDAAGNVALRADGFNTASPGALAGDNIVQVRTSLRSATVNTVQSSGLANSAAEPASTTFVVNNSNITTNTPAMLPASLAGSSPIGLIMDFALKYRPAGIAGDSSHFAPGVTSHRGNPVFSTINTLGGIGTAASFARTTASRTDSINVFAVSNTGAPSAARVATLPSPITGPGGFSANSHGDNEFKQYLSQTSFRGPSGQTAIGLDPASGTLLAAGVATDSIAGEYLAVARMTAAPTWSVAARIGSPILSGPAGSTMGTITAGSPVTFSAPAMDTLGNVYFVATYTPTTGPAGTALLKAVNLPAGAGYAIELLLSTGQIVTGVNSTRSYTITRLWLGDSDSIASSTLHAGSILQGQMPGATTNNAASPLAFGGLGVNARISYNNGGTPESYDALLFLGARATPPGCTADINGDGITNTVDLTILLNKFGQSVTPGTNGDLNGDGVVNTIDLTALLGNFGCGT